MILVRMREHDAGEAAALLDEIADIRKDQLDAGKVLFGGKGHAEIHREPAVAALIADAVDRHIHADLANAAKRRKHQLLLRGHQLCPKANTSPAAMTCVDMPVTSSNWPFSSIP